MGAQPDQLNQDGLKRHEKHQHWPSREAEEPRQEAAQFAPLERRESAREQREVEAQASEVEGKVRRGLGDIRAHDAVEIADRHCGGEANPERAAAGDE